MHSTIEMSPNDALKPTNALWISWHWWGSAKRDRKYTEIKEGDMVQNNNKKGEFSKYNEPNWSTTRHKIVAIKGNQYFIPNVSNNKLYLRHACLNM